MRRLFTFYRVIALLLALFAVSYAGYYANAAYLAYLEKGWYLTSSDEDPGNPLSFIGTIASVLLVPLAFASLRTGVSPFVLPFLLIPAWQAISGEWSHVLPQSLLAAGKTAIYVLGIREAVRPLRQESLVRCVAIMALVICGASIVLGLMDPIFRISIGSEGWRGLFAQKNRLAMFSLFSLILIFPALFTRGAERITLVTLPTLMACLVLSQGKAALAIALVYMITAASFIFFGGRRGSKRDILRISLYLAMLLFITALIIGVLISMTEVTFTGRVGLWRWFLHDLGDRIILGAGGTTAPNDPALVARAKEANGTVASGSSYVAATSDSSYVMLLYNMGIIGVGLYLGVIANLWARCVKISGAYAIFAIMTLVAYVVFAFAESDARFDLSFPTIALLLQMLMLEKRSQQKEDAAEILSPNEETVDAVR